MLNWKSPKWLKLLDANKSAFHHQCRIGLLEVQVEEEVLLQRKLLDSGFWEDKLRAKPPSGRAWPGEGGVPMSCIFIAQQHTKWTWRRMKAATFCYIAPCPVLDLGHHQDSEAEEVCLNEKMDCRSRFGCFGPLKNLNLDWPTKAKANVWIFSRQKGHRSWCPVWSPSPNLHAHSIWLQPYCGPCCNMRIASLCIFVKLDVLHECACALG